MQNVRRLRVMIACVGLVLVSACGGSGGSDSSKDKALSIAFPVPLTSGNSTIAKQMVNTAKLAVKTINSDGGAGGRKLKLRIYDDKLSADESAKIAQRAITVDGAEIVMGGYTSIEGLAIREVTERRKVIQVATSTTSPQLTDGATYTYRVSYRSNGSLPVMAELFKSLGIKKPVVLYDDGPTGSSLHRPLFDQLKNAGLDPVKPVGFSLNATDLSSQASAVKDAGADGVILLGSSAADAGLLVKTLVEQGVEEPVLGISALVSPDALKIGGAAYGKLPAVYVLANFQPSKPLYRSFVEKYAKEYGGSAEDLAAALGEANAQTWDAFALLTRALDATKGKTSGDVLAKALSQVKPFEGAAGKAGSLLGFASTHDGYKDSLSPFRLENGQVAEFKIDDQG